LAAEEAIRPVFQSRRLLAVLVEMLERPRPLEAALAVMLAVSRHNLESVLAERAVHQVVALQ
jgi:hypothetical protein